MPLPKFCPARLPFAIASPLLCYFIECHSAQWFNGYRFSYELLLMNALFTFIGLCLLIKKGTRA